MQGLCLWSLGTGFPQPCPATVSFPTAKYSSPFLWLTWSLRHLPEVCNRPHCFPSALQWLLLMLHVLRGRQALPSSMTSMFPTSGAQELRPEQFPMMHLQVCLLSPVQKDVASAQEVIFWSTVMSLCRVSASPHLELPRSLWTFDLPKANICLGSLLFLCNFAV